MIRNLMSDEGWAFFAPYVIESGPAWPSPRNHRLVLDGIFWIIRTGAQWRDLPSYFGPWSSVYRQFRRWTLSGLWDVLLEALNDTDDVPGRLQMLDSTVVRATIALPGQRGPQKEGFGRSKGGFTTKVHLRTNAAGLPIAAEIGRGQDVLTPKDGQPPL